MNNPNLFDYLQECRWFGLKEDIRRGNISDIRLEKLSFDNGNKLFCLGEAMMASGEKRYFSMPLALKGAMGGGQRLLVLDGGVYADASLEPDFWQSLNRMMRDNGGKVQFPNGWTFEYDGFGGIPLPEGNEAAESRPLNVEQSNTTINVGNGMLAFKLERMLEFAPEVNSEFEMNEKLMREKCSVMPRTYGGFIWRRPDGQQAAGGIVQEYVKNRGDMWNFLLDYLEKKLEKHYLHQMPLTAKNSPEFMELMHNLSSKTQEMSECLSRPDSNPNFTPEPADASFARGYGKQMEVLLYQVKRTIQQNMERLPEPALTQAEKLLKNWDETTSDFVGRRFDAIRQSGYQGSFITRVHGDFHLGQVMVTPEKDLRFIDFAGEPALPMEQRKQKHIDVRDIAGMYRSIKGYLGAVAVENFAAKAQDAEVAQRRKQWAQKAIKPLIDSASEVFLGDRKMSEPWLGLEILRKNLYEVNYEVGNRPEMAYVPISGLFELLPTQNTGAANDNVLAKFGKDGTGLQAG